tara:strand:- start:1271 stop:1612 length:342 start_codon:yes stop_codon:yes gene_type:complete
MIREAIMALIPNAQCIYSDFKIMEWHDTRPQPTESEIQAKIAELTAAEPLRLLRQHRNQLLAQSDWMAVADRTMTPAQIAYRQALRDLTTHSSPELDANGKLTGVNWPTPPTD